MLQRAASNAYSWWWASHIRTKQSKWLDNNLQDMEDKVRGMLKLIEEDADTFAKKAEMYFRRRPELINFVEESYKSYRALAERYDHLSGELQKANNTIATVFPDQVHFGMDEDDDDQSPKSTAVDLSRCQKPSLHPIPNNNDCTTTTTTTAVVIGNKDVMVVEKPKHENTHHSSDETAKEEMSAIQKEILALQTEREFVKCSYEIGLTKYWGIEKKISELQEKVCSLQDECCADVVIEDDEARALMAVSALTSCQDTLLNLHDHQKRSTEEARKESQRIENAKQKLRAIRGEDGPPQPVDDDNEDSDTDVGEYLEEVCSLDQTGLELRSAREKARKNFEMNSETSILDLADKINELVNKVIELESTLSSQTSQIQRLRLENDELQKNLLHLEERKITCDDTKDMGDKLRQAEEELRKVEDIHRCVRDESIMLRTRFNEACGTFRVLSDTLQSPEQQHTAGSSEERDGTPSEHEADHVNQQNSEPPKQNHPTGNDGVKAVVERPTDLESDVLRENINIISVDDQNQDVADHGPKDAGEKSEENPEAEDEVDGKDTSQQNHRSWGWARAPGMFLATSRGRS